MIINAADALIISILVAFILAVVGVVLMILDSARSDKGEDEGKGKYGGVVIIGPIPIIFGNDSSIIKWAIALTIVAVIIFILLVIVPLIGV
ncbi:TIGR00304 family membrane protein [Caldivirga sp. UBA161]|uniref:TIGR00304 family membrane protein n=1 Tax=Caldivirga sp. UBA161 TaxID=1915569 RepID=UPI0025BC5623|nr:DUF131 domain-containing protein [Caldivirga sp. UBA161]